MDFLFFFSFNKSHLTAMNSRNAPERLVLVVLRYKYARAFLGQPAITVNHHHTVVVVLLCKYTGPTGLHLLSVGGLPGTVPAEGMACGMRHPKSLCGLQTCTLFDGSRTSIAIAEARPRFQALQIPNWRHD